MSEITATNSLRTMTNSIDLGPTGSIQFQFAKLQMALSQMAKTSAMNYIEEIQNSQEEQKKIAALLDYARTGQAAAKEGKGNAGKTGDGVETIVNEKCWEMTSEQRALMEKHGLSGSANSDGDYRYGADESEIVIQALKAKLDELGSSTQQNMVFVQDFMGQYNSYLQGSNAAIREGNQTLSSIANSR